MVRDLSTVQAIVIKALLFGFHMTVIYGVICLSYDFWDHLE